ncbi:cytochrome P450 [Cercophora samala]|uniref:Cytochrome P450 n=1 Tax=Cercophora samala TaxID=330535 RepID=A0AA39ZJ09_9PEZI|nr:cytochrome P450 [Cercophora samala]
MALLDIYTSLSSFLSSANTLWLAVALTVIGSYLLYQWLLPKPLPGIPFNTEATKSLFGDAPAMSREISVTGEFSMWLAHQVEKMGEPICQVFIRPFSKPWILVGDFHEAQDILMRRTEFEKPQFLIDGLIALGDFNARLKTNDPRFRARRHLKQDLMAPNFLNNYMGPFIHTEGLKLVKLLEAKMKLSDGRPFSALADYYHAALDTMIYYAFGGNFPDSALDPQLQAISNLEPSQISPGGKDEPVVFPDAPTSPFLTAVHHAPDVLEKTTIAWSPKLAYWWMSQQAWYKKIFSQKKQVVQKQLEAAIHNFKAGEVKTAMEHLVMREKVAAEKQGREPQLNSQLMLDEIFADMISGHHTTGGSMGWVTKYLTGFPEAQTKLRKALYSALPSAAAEQRPPTFDELRHAKIPYLEAVIEETLRLTPFSMTRETAQDTEILGYKIPKGCQVMMVNAGPGYLSPSLPVNENARSPTSKAAKRRPNWDETKDLKLFDPERWLVTKEDGSVEFDSAAGPQLGFGMGLRQCWGRKLAQLEIRTIMALVVWNFELLGIPEGLGGYAGYDGVSRQPQKVYVRLRKMNSW